MVSVFEKQIILHNTLSMKIINRELHTRHTQSMLTEVLMPLSIEEAWLEELFDELVNNNLLGENAPESEWFVWIAWDLLTIKITYWQEITKTIRALYN